MSTTFILREPPIYKVDSCRIAKVKVKIEVNLKLFTANIRSKDSKVCIGMKEDSISFYNRQTKRDYYSRRKLENIILLLAIKVS